jgi:hypothetical protein
MGWIRSIARPIDVVKASSTSDVVVPKPPTRWQYDPDTSDWQYATEVPSQMHPGTVGLTYETLHSMSRIPVIGAIIQTRVNQIADFAHPQPDPYSLGYRIRHRDLKHVQTKKDDRIVREITEVIERAGGPYWYGGFEGFLRSLVRDSMTYDQANFEVIRDRSGRPWGFVPVDPSTIRRAKPPEKGEREGTLDPDDVSFVQIVGKRIVTEFDRNELAWCIRRPRSWIYANGYGYPELEELMTVVTNILNAETFNAVNFTNGIHARTILGLKSSMDEGMFKAFKREVVALMSGVGNSRRVPIVQLDPEFKEELAAIPLDRSNREMEYREWLNWLLKVICGGFQMDPAEIGFVFGNEGQSSSLAGSSVGDRVSLSREKGLRPLLRAIAHWLNEWVVQPFNEDYMIEFTGFDSATEAERTELDVKAVTNWMTLDELRAQKDMEPMPDDQGKIILNPTFLQAKQQADMMAQQQQQGEPGEDDGDDEEQPSGLFDQPGDEPDIGGGVQDDDSFSGSEGPDRGEQLAASQAGTQYGEVDGVWELSGRLKKAYDDRMAELIRTMRRMK